MPIYKSEKVLSKTIVQSNLPINSIDSELYLFKNDISKELPDVFLHYLKNIKVTPHGIIFNKLKIIDQFLIWPQHKNEFNLPYLVRNYFFRKKVNLVENKKYIICFDYWSMGYFHWMCDFLPKLLLLENYLNTSILILPSNHVHSYVEDSLRIFNIDKVVRFSDQEYISCAEAIVPSKICNSGDNNPMMMQKLRAKFIAFYNPKTDNNSFSQNLYVSRSKAKGRFIINEKEVMETVESLGFKTIYFEDYSLEDQIKIMYNCKNLIGLHGANLTNLMFMNPNSNILELRNEGDIQNNYYFLLASSFNLNYFYLQCKSANVLNKQTFNVNVNVTKLKNEILKMLTY